MPTYEVVSGKHHIPMIKNKRVVLQTYKPGQRFKAEKFEVRHIKDKVSEIKEKQKAVREEVINAKIKTKFQRKQNASD